MRNSSQTSRTSVNRQTPRPSLGQRGRAYCTRHVQTLLSSLGRLARTPGASFMTAAVIGIALALPTGLQVLISNAENLSGAWEGTARISLFLKHGITTAGADALAAELRQKPGIGAVTVISADQALAEFRKHSGFGAALDLLDENPLPALLVVYPAPSADSARATSQLAEQLRLLPQAGRIVVDTRWLQRLQAILAIVHRAVLVVASLLAAAVIIIVGNTIRLDIQNRRQEIEVSKLIGATDAFIRRPFLYAGLWYGFAGGLMAWLLVNLALWLMSTPVRNLTALYGSSFTLSGLSLKHSLVVFAAGGILGWLGSWSAVRRHLGEIEPS